MNNFHFRFDDFSEAQIFGHIENLIDFRVNQRAVIADQRKANFRFLINIVRSHLGHRQIKRVAQSADHRFNNLALALQRTAIMQPQRDESGPHYHGRFVPRDELRLRIMDRFTRGALRLRLEA